MLMVTFTRLFDLHLLEVNVICLIFSLPVAGRGRLGRGAEMGVIESQV